jgi:hypothetical protein
MEIFSPAFLSNFPIVITNSPSRTSVATDRIKTDLTERVNLPLTIHERLRPAEVLRSPTENILLDFVRANKEPNGADVPRLRPSSD